VNLPSPAAKLSREKQATPDVPRSLPGGRLRRLKAWLLCLACVALSAVATFAGFEIFWPVRVPVAMRGKWVVVEGKGLKGATLEFTADGRMVGNVQIEGKDVTINGRVEVQGNHFRVTTVSPGGGVAVTESEEILDLNERRFVVQDSHGEVLIMQRPSATGDVR
jgi:hypothetical protein